jgi:hypothetical protein
LELPPGPCAPESCHVEVLGVFAGEVEVGHGLFGRA